MPPFFVSGALWRGFAAGPGNGTGDGSERGERGVSGAFGRGRCNPVQRKGKILNKNPCKLYISPCNFMVSGVDYEYCIRPLFAGG